MRFSDASVRRRARSSAGARARHRDWRLRRLPEQWPSSVVPTAGAAPGGITPSFDGNHWFTETAASKVARITPSGTVTEFPLGRRPWAHRHRPRPRRQPAGSPRPTGNRIGRIGTDGTGLTEFALPNPDSTPLGDRQRPRRQPLVHRVDRQPHRPHHHRGRRHRVRAAERDQRTARDRGRTRRQPLVHRDRPATASAASPPPASSARSALPEPRAAVPSSSPSAADSRVWFTERTGDRVGRLEADFTGLVEFAVPTGTGPGRHRDRMRRQPLVHARAPATASTGSRPTATTITPFALPERGQRSRRDHQRHRPRPLGHREHRQPASRASARAATSPHRSLVLAGRRSPSARHRAHRRGRELLGERDRRQRHHRRPRVRPAVGLHLRGGRHDRPLRGVRHRRQPRHRLVHGGGHTVREPGRTRAVQQLDALERQGALAASSTALRHEPRSVTDDLRSPRTRSCADAHQSRADSPRVFVDLTRRRRRRCGSCPRRRPTDLANDMKQVRVVDRLRRRAASARRSDAPVSRARPSAG